MAGGTEPASVFIKNTISLAAGLASLECQQLDGDCQEITILNLSAFRTVRGENKKGSPLDTADRLLLSIAGFLLCAVQWRGVASLHKSDD